MPKEPIAPCDNCMLTTTSTFNFLLNCCVCKRGFHHRCCNPPVPDVVLLSLLHATSKNKPGKGVKYWKCQTCRERQSVTAIAGPSRPPLPPRQAGTGSNNTSSKPEIIVISDDEDEPPKDIVISSRPPTHKPDAQGKSQLPPAPPAPQTPMNAIAGSIDVIQAVPPRDYDDAMDVDMDVFEAPPVSSTSRFGLLSPPVSASESSSVRYTSTTPFSFEGNDIPLQPSSPKPELRLKTLAETKTSDTTSSGVVRGVALITPPISTRTASPIGQGPSAPSTLAPRRTRKHDLKVLSKEFKETFGVRRVPSAPLASSTMATTGRRKPFKSVAKSLDRNNKVPSQRTFNCFGFS